MRSRMMTAVLAVTVFFLMSGASFAQGWQWGQSDGWYYQGHREANYDRGVRDGRSDREHGRGWHPQGDGQAYLNGYRAGYGQDGGGRDRDGYRGPGGNPQTVAYNNGFREGVGYGQSDRNNGHSFRPTYSATYRNGHNGYNSSYGSEMAYKRAFQDGFRAGYDRGYNGGGVRR